MRKSYQLSLLFFISLSLWNLTFAQNRRDLPAVYSGGIKTNFARTWTAVAPESNPAMLITRSGREVIQVTMYVDGSGRKLQTVIKDGSLVNGGSPVDLINAALFSWRLNIWYRNNLKLGIRP